ncbi:MAG: TIGR04282 family arsenosugar biosynthesis glycosyltransferase [Methylococcaceae bacterium]|nr:TIGR04282 family arsenosugar biosynthesis glycosyltransferase [Methylococcaceae bacterium]
MLNYQYPDTVLLIFCKAPIAGQVKTRLIPTLTAEQAMQLHIELSLSTLQRATQNTLCPVQLWCTPTMNHAFFTTAVHDYPITLMQQQGDDLGERMNHALCTALKHYKRAVLIGCDCPSLTSQDLANAITALNDKITVVFAPAEDGGYVLIGLNRPHPELFHNMPWSNERLMQKTRTCCQQQGIIYYELAIQWDVDTPKDLARYYQSKQV